PTTYRSPGRIWGIRAERAAWNGGFTSDAANSRTSIAQTGMPSIATSTMRPARSRSQATITDRYRRRSAMAARSGPPRSHGRKLIANAVADRATDLVSVNTRAVTAAL